MARSPYGDATTGATPSGTPYEDPNPYVEPPPVDQYAPPSYAPSGGILSAPYDWTTDPTYQAYVAALDLSLAQQQSETTRRRDQIMGNQTQLLDRSGQAGDLERENVNNGYESRGLLNSGGRLQGLARQQANQGSRENTIKTNAANSTSDVEAALAQAVAQAGLKRQNAAQGIFG